MGSYVNTAGGWLQGGYNRIVDEPLAPGGLVNSILMAGSGLPGQMEYGINSVANASNADWENSSKKVNAEENATKQAMNDAINAFNTRPSSPAPPTMPEESGGGYEPVTMPTYTPPITAPTINKKSSTYTPKRTTTVLTKPGDASAGGKGKKTLLGQ